LNSSVTRRRSRSSKLPDVWSVTLHRPGGALGAATSVVGVVGSTSSSGMPSSAGVSPSGASPLGTRVSSAGRISSAGAAPRSSCARATPRSSAQQSAALAKRFGLMACMVHPRSRAQTSRDLDF